MSSDLGTQIEDIIEWVTGIIAGLGFLLPIAVILFFNLFGKKGDKKNEPKANPPKSVTRNQPLPPVTQPVPGFPVGPSSWMEVDTPPPPSTRRVPGMSTAWGSTFDDNDAAKHDEPLQWGSSFDDNDAALKWGSAFDNPRERTQWGFEQSDWESSFGPKKKVEPKITVG